MGPNFQSHEIWLNKHMIASFCLFEFLKQFHKNIFLIRAYYSKLKFQSIQIQMNLHSVKSLKWESLSVGDRGYENVADAERFYELC